MTLAFLGDAASGRGRRSEGRRAAGGWSKVATMLDRYAHALPVNDRAAADVLGEMITGDR
jgi:hypothetical protein